MNTGPVPPATLPTIAAAAPGEDAPSGFRLLRSAALIVLAVAGYGLLVIPWLESSGLAAPRRPPPWNVYYHLFARHEGPFLWLLAVSSLAALGLSLRRSGPAVLATIGSAGARLEALALRVSPWLLALVVLAACGAGTIMVLHDVSLSMDEHAIDFQARLLRAGRLTAPIPEMWQPLAGWMTPTFVNYQPIDQRWVAAYFPVAASVRALFGMLGLDRLANPALAAGSIVLLAACASRLWPAHPRRRLLAVLLLASSSQLLIMSMTRYSMPAYLFFNLLWLWLYLREDRAARIALPWVGLLALGLHNPFPHALFVAPFLIRTLRERRWTWLSYWAVVYVAAAALWLGWLRLSAGTPVPGAPPQQGLLANFKLPNLHALMVQGMNLALVFSWQTPVLALLLLAALLAWRSLETRERDLAAGLLLTFAFYFLYPLAQGHGWGYRYTYGALGNIVLLAALGAAILARRGGEGMRRGLPLAIAASLAVTLLVQLPLRAAQVERFTAPWARGLELIASRPAPIVAIDVSAGWYAQDLVRNDPLFEREPRVFWFAPGRGPHPSQLPPALRDSVFVLSARGMQRLGMETFGAAPAPARPAPGAR